MPCRCGPFLRPALCLVALCGPLARGEELVQPPPLSIFVPIVLSAGGAQGSYFTTELTFTNRGSGQVTAEMVYKAALGAGSGTVTDALAPGEQKVVPDAIAYLRGRGLAIPEGQDAGGTVLVKLRGLAAPADGAVTARTTTRVPEGRAGLAYGGVLAGHTSGSSVCGLRQNGRDRSNLALVHTGEPGSGNVTVSITVYRSQPGTGSSKTLPSVTLAPGGFEQINNVLEQAGFDEGWVKLGRTSGSASYYAYGVINDQANSDGSFVASLSDSTTYGTSFGVCLPVVVEAGVFTSEVTLTNTGTTARTIDLTFVSDAIQNPSGSVTVGVSLAGMEQRLIPDFVDFLRKATPGLPPRNATTIAGALIAVPGGGTSFMSSVVVGCRTAAPGGGGQYGVFYTATTLSKAFPDAAWIYGLRQDAENRTNLALVNTGQPFGDTQDEFQVDLYDGRTGALARSVTGIEIPPGGWLQIPTILATYAPGVEQGYAKVTRTSGHDDFLAYGVVNDGAGPGQRSGDGAYIGALPECAYGVPATPQAFGTTGGSATLSATVTSGCPWNVSSNDSWITFPGATTGVSAGNASVSYAVGRNASATARSGTVTLATRPITIYQHGDAPGPYDGTWSGTTLQGKPISFRIEKNEVTTLTLGLDLTSGGCHAAGTYTAVPATKPAVYQDAFNGRYSLSASGQASLDIYLYASFSSPTAASGGYGASDIWSGGAHCIYIGSGPGWAFTVQKGP